MYANVKRKPVPTRTGARAACSSPGAAWSSSVASPSWIGRDRAVAAPRAHQLVHGRVVVAARGEAREVAAVHERRVVVPSARSPRLALGRDRPPREQPAVGRAHAGERPPLRQAVEPERPRHLDLRRASSGSPGSTRARARSRVSTQMYGHVVTCLAVERPRSRRRRTPCTARAPGRPAPRPTPSRTASRRRARRTGRDRRRTARCRAGSTAATAAGSAQYSITRKSPT